MIFHHSLCGKTVLTSMFLLIVTYNSQYQNKL